MFKEFSQLAATLDIFTRFVLVCLAILTFLCLIRSIIGPKMSDRLVAVNALSTMVMVMIATLAIKLNEGFLADVCLIYAMISFLAVIVGTKVYMGVYLENRDKRKGLK
ncbi:MAG: monovalent cation/H+ antiporter complex subunit F [Traorella sp.]